jgi:pimeloyl-ACP methyl ester carboxylesterase
MSTQPTPTIVLVHGAFADSSSWNPVVAHLQADGNDVVSVANPLRSLAGDAAYLRDVIDTLDSPVVLVGHSYAGMLITEAASDNTAVRALVYVSAFAPEHGQSAFELSGSHPGSTLGDALAVRPLAGGGNEFTIRQGLFPEQFAADVPATDTVLMAVAQRPVTEAALTDALPTSTPAWKQVPSWHIFGELDRNIPAAVLRDGAARAGARSTVEVPGAAHALSLSHPSMVAEIILDAARATV